jgi:hypothetical protein
MKKTEEKFGKNTGGRFKMTDETRQPIERMSTRSLLRNFKEYTGKDVLVNGILIPGSFRFWIGEKRNGVYNDGSCFLLKSGWSACLYVDVYGGSYPNSRSELNEGIDYKRANFELIKPSEGKKIEVCGRVDGEEVPFIHCNIIKGNQGLDCSEHRIIPYWTFLGGRTLL